MLFQVSVKVNRSNKDMTDVRDESYVGFVDLVTPEGDVDPSWLLTKAKTIDDHLMDSILPLDVAVEVAKQTNVWKFPAKQETSEFSLKYYNRSQKLSVKVALTINRMSIPRVRIPKTDAQHSEE